MDYKTEKQKIDKMNEDMYCKKYDMHCMEVPDEILLWIGGCGFSNYECELDCNTCSDMEQW